MSSQCSCAACSYSSASGVRGECQKPSCVSASSYWAVIPSSCRHVGGQHACLLPSKDWHPGVWVTVLNLQHWMRALATMQNHVQGACKGMRGKVQAMLLPQHLACQSALAEKMPGVCARDAAVALLLTGIYLGCCFGLGVTWAIALRSMHACWAWYVCSTVEVGASGSVTWHRGQAGVVTFMWWLGCGTATASPSGTP